MLTAGVRGHTALPSQCHNWWGPGLNWWCHVLAMASSQKSWCCVFSQHNVAMLLSCNTSLTTEPIFPNLWRRTENGPRNNQANFGKDPYFIGVLLGLGGGLRFNECCSGYGSNKLDQRFSKCTTVLLINDQLRLTWLYKYTRNHWNCDR